MNKGIISSGFLFHPGSQQVLLQQNLDDPTICWTLLGGPGVIVENDHGDFGMIIKKLLGLHVDPGNIYKVYDYYHPGWKKKHFISYSVVDVVSKFPQKEGRIFEWFNMKEVLKLTLSGQTKQDIIVGFRVIDSGVRRAAGEQTIG